MIIEYWELNSNDLEDLETLYAVGMGIFKGVNDEQERLYKSCGISKN